MGGFATTILQPPAGSSGIVIAGQGSSTAPSYTFAGSPTTGWFLNAGVPTLVGPSVSGQGFSLINGATSQKAETQAADANVLTFTPPAAVGTYRVSVAISVTSATTGVISYTVSWTDSSGNAQSNIAGPLFQYGTAAPNTTFTTSAAGNYAGYMVIDVNNAAAAIIVKWVGGGTTVAKVSAVIERLI